MRSILCFLVFAAGAMGQTAGDDKVAIANLTATLVGIGKADASPARLTERLADDMLALANRDHEPSRTVVLGFTKEFTAAIHGKELAARSVTVLQESFVDVMRATSATFVPAASLRQILGQAGVDSDNAQLITRRFMAIGEEIKGPDDLGSRNQNK